MSIATHVIAEHADEFASVEFGEPLKPCFFVSVTKDVHRGQFLASNISHADLAESFNLLAGLQAHALGAGVQDVAWL